MKVNWYARCTRSIQRLFQKQGTFHVSQMTGRHVVAMATQTTRHPMGNHKTNMKDHGRMREKVGAHGRQPSTSPTFWSRSTSFLSPPSPSLSLKVPVSIEHLVKVSSYYAASSHTHSAQRNLTKPYVTSETHVRNAKHNLQRVHMHIR